MDDFRRKPVNRRPLPPVTPPEGTPLTANQPVEVQPTPQIIEPPVPSTVGTEGVHEETPIKKQRSKKKAILWIIGSALGVLLIATGVIVTWYNVQLSPVDSSETNKVVVEIASGTTPAGIAATLKENNLIRNEDAFLWYTRLNGSQNYLQAGTYRLSPSESTPQIVEHLKNGTVDTFSITFLPGATLTQNRTVLLTAGYSEEEIDAAFAASYESPLFASKPATADLEGYIYGNTYKFSSGASVQEILEHVFDVYAGVVKENNLVEKFQQQGLSLYQGITLASIIQRESGGGDEAQIAQVFYSRLALGMPLGSDVTYQYIADKLGVPRDPNLDSPYNTRRYTGLPPGPIAAPGVKALVAAANPAEGDYLYFLSGDDDVTYFGRTLQEHEQNIANHCQKKCQIL